MITEIESVGVERIYVCRDSTDIFFWEKHQSFKNLSDVLDESFWECFITLYLRQENFSLGASVDLQTCQELPHHLGLQNLAHVVDLYIRLPQVR